MLTDNLLYSQGKDGGVPNYGFHLFTNDLYTSVSKHICSSEHSNIYYRPKIVLSYEDPYQLELNDETYDYINAADPSDWYSFTPVETGLYDIFTTSDVDTYGQLYSSDLSLLQSNDDSGDDFNFKISAELQAGSTYYIRVRGLSSVAIGFYSIEVENRNETFFENLNVLHNLANSYDDSKGMELLLQFIRSRTESYTTDMWDMVAGRTRPRLYYLCKRK